MGVVVAGEFSAQRRITNLEEELADVLEDQGVLHARNEALREALKSIIKHNHIVGKDMAGMMATTIIAERALRMTENLK